MLTALILFACIASLGFWLYTALAGASSATGHATDPPPKPDPQGVRLDSNPSTERNQ